jgi:predicted aspartyl protease
MIYRLRFFLALLISCAISVQASAQNAVVEKIPFMVNNDHIIIKIRLDDSEPLNFIFDTGAGATLISKTTADSLQFVSGSKRKNVGVSGEHKVMLIKGISIGIGESQIMENANLLSTQTYFEELDNGEQVHGVIGYDLLSKYVVEIDNNQQQLVLSKTSDYKYQGDGYELPIYIVQNLPIINAIVSTYNGTEFEGQFMVDTGARSDIIINSPTVFKYDLAENVGKHYTIRANIGTSTRRTKMRYGRLASFRFADQTFEDVPVALSSDNKGVLSMDFIDGIIGNKLLKRFNMVLDYSRERIYLEPGEAIDQEYSINLTGFNLSFQDGNPVIKNMVDRSPADKAGLRNGDQIISINSVLVENMSSEEIRNAFNREGETIAIVIKRNNKFKYTEFRPKPLI